jgi:hypothetical protein
MSAVRRTATAIRAMSATTISVFVLSVSLRGLHSTLPFSPLALWRTKKSLVVYFSAFILQNQELLIIQKNLRNNKYRSRLTVYCLL